MKPGTNVIHGSLGSGTLQSLNGTVATVLFDSGLVKDVNVADLQQLVLS